MDLEIAERFAEFADLFVEEGDFLKVSGVLFSFVEYRACEEVSRWGS